MPRHYLDWGKIQDDLKYRDHPFASIRPSPAVGDVVINKYYDEEKYKNDCKEQRNIYNALYEWAENTTREIRETEERERVEYGNIFLTSAQKCAHEEHWWDVECPWCYLLPRDEEIAPLPWKQPNEINKEDYLLETITQKYLGSGRWQKI